MDERRGEGHKNKQGMQLMRLSDIVGVEQREGLNRLLLGQRNNVVKSGAVNHRYCSLSSVNRKKSLMRQ